MTDKKPDKSAPEPAESDALDLDTLEREGGTPLPFKFSMKTSTGDHKTFFLSDPQEIDWQNLILAMRDPLLFLRLVLPADDHDAFFGTPLASWKLNALMVRYQKHYGIPPLPEPSGSAR